MNKDRKAFKALKAVHVLIDYINNDGSYYSNAIWVDSKGYALHTDVGYFFEGLAGLSELLDKRCRGCVPEFPKACEKYKEQRGKNERL